MAIVAGVRHFQGISGRGCNETESVGANIHVRDRLLNAGHMAGNAFVTGRPFPMMRVFLNAGRVRSIRRFGAVTIEAEHVGRLRQKRIVGRTMRIMAGITCDAVRVHRARHEVIALHAILVGSPICEMREGRLAGFVLLQFPEIFQMLAHMESDGPVISLSGGRSGQGLPLRMALNAGVGCVNVVEAGGINDIRLRWLLHVLAARAVTLFAANVPLGYFLRHHIVIYRVAAIAGGARGAFHVVVGIIPGPPIRPNFNLVRTPDFISHVPLGRQWEKIITCFLEISLLPFAPVYQGDLIL